MAKEALERSRWIPTAERLPDKSGLYLVTVRSWQVPLVTGVDVFYFSKTNMSEAHWNKDNTLWKANDPLILAWCELPEPYRVESEKI